MKPPDLTTLPRDSVIITEERLSLPYYRRSGFPVVYIGSPSVPNYEALRDNWSRLTRRNPSAHVCGPDELHDTVNQLCLMTHVNNNTAMSRSRRWVTHMLQNLHRVTGPMLMAQPDALKGLPCFIVGAGPSLDKNVHLIEECKSRGLVIAINGASMRCNPHVTMCLEANDMSAKLDPGESVKAFALTCPPKLFDLGTGPSCPVYTGEISECVELLVGAPRLATCGSGSTAAVSLAARMGCDPIIMLGQDLALDGGMYADGIPMGNTPKPTDEEQTETESWDGTRRVPSMASFDAVARWLSSAARHMKGRLINATEGGRRIGGWESQSLRSVLDSLPPTSAEIKIGSHGVTEQQLADWAQDQLFATRSVQGLAERGFVDTSDVALWLRKATLVDPWCIGPVLSLMGERRRKPPFASTRREAQSARACRANLAEMVHSEIGGLIEMLEGVTA